MSHVFFHESRILILLFVLAAGLMLTACMPGSETTTAPTETPGPPLPAVTSSAPTETPGPPPPTDTAFEPTTISTFTASPPAATVTLVPSTYEQCSSLRSVEGSTSITVSFENRSGRAVNIYWIDYQGAEQFYFDLQPGQAKPQDTYVTHAWCARDKTSNAPLLAVVATQDGQVATVVGQAVQRLDCTSGWTRLQADSYAKVSEAQPSPNRVREAPDTGAKIIERIDPGAIVRVVEGPVCEDGLVFWKVESALIPGGVGWTAEGDGKEYYLEPMP